MRIQVNDIVISENKILQFLGREMENGVILQDIHTLKTLTHINLIDRKANKDEVKWFCENTEKINFTTPKQEV